MSRITRRIEFDAMHRVVNHEGKCARLHGHRYVALVSVRANELDNVARVVDFSLIKERIGGWIDTNWDHNAILNSADPLLKFLSVADAQVTRYRVEGRSQAPKPVSDEVFNHYKPFILPNVNPTVEIMVQVLYLKAQMLLADMPHLSVYKVRLYETPNSHSDHYERDPINEALSSLTK